MGMSLPILSSIQPAQTCVWMDAGMVAFRLCDRGFACEHCPFDAAMRCDPRACMADDSDSARKDPAAWSFPADRLYTQGHIWVQVIRDGRVRAGIDACAARLLRRLRQIRHTRGFDALRRGDPLCTLVIDGGVVPIGSPVSGRVCVWNDALDRTPSIVTSEPYSGGWLAELTVPRLADLDGLLNAQAAMGRAELEARRLRRQVAFHLLSTDMGPEPWLDASSLDAAHQLMGPDSFVTAARQLIY